MKKRVTTYFWSGHCTFVWMWKLKFESWVLFIKGVRVQIGSAQPRMKQNQDHGGHTGGHTGGHYGGRGNYGYAPDPWQSGSQG